MAVMGFVNVRRGSPRLPLGLAALAVVWTLAYVIDAPMTSLPRLHAPAAAVVCVLAALGVDDARRRLARLGGRFTTHATVGLAVLVVASAAPSIPSLIAPTNEIQDEGFFRRAVAALPDAPVCFVRIGPGDTPSKGKTHRYHADYLLRPPNRDDRVYGLHAWETDRSSECSGATYFYLGLLCYAAESSSGARTMPEREVQVRCLWGDDCWRAASHHEGDDEAPPRSPLVSACARAVKEWPLVPIIEEDLPNLGANEFGYYPEIPTFRVGLYRVDPGSSVE